MSSQSSLVVSWQRIYTSLTVTTVHIKYSFQSWTSKSTELVAISSQSSSTAVSRDSLNYSSYSLGTDQPENIVSIVIAQQYLDCWLLIRCSGNVSTESLPSNKRLLWLRYYSGFQGRHVKIYSLSRTFLTAWQEILDIFLVSAPTKLT
jgi:hypothetical protein